MARFLESRTGIFLVGALMLGIIVWGAYAIFGYTLETVLVVLVLWPCLLGSAIFIALCWLTCYAIGWLYDQHLEGKRPHRAVDEQLRRLLRLERNT